ncbi:unnamed protein product, partial [Heterosigma akashiwo]
RRRASGGPAGRRPQHVRPAHGHRQAVHRHLLWPHGASRAGGAEWGSLGLDWGDLFPDWCGVHLFWPCRAIAAQNRPFPYTSFFLIPSLT